MQWHGVTHKYSHTPPLSPWGWLANTPGREQQSPWPRKKRKINTCICNTIHLYCFRWSQRCPLAHCSLITASLPWLTAQWVRGSVHVQACVLFKAGKGAQAKGFWRYKEIPNTLGSPKPLYMARRGDLNWQAVKRPEWLYWLLKEGKKHCSRKGKS